MFKDFVDFKLLGTQHACSIHCTVPNLTGIQFTVTFFFCFHIITVLSTGTVDYTS